MAEAQKKAGLSLYAHLLGDSATISSAPVKYDQIQQTEEEAAKAAQKKKDASLQFQPVKRPQVKAKPKSASSAAPSSSTHKFSSSTVTSSSLPQGPTSTPSVQRSNFEDWVGDDDDEFYYQDRKPKSKGNKKKRKQQQQQEARTWDWDDIYDPTRPNNYADYKGSEEQYREHRDWKARLYYHQLKDARKARKKEEAQKKPANSMFAPPANLSFAPPSFGDSGPPRQMDVDNDTEYHLSEPPTSDASIRKSSFAPPSFAPPAVSDDATGEDAYARRMRMSGMARPAQSPTPRSSPPKPAAPPAQPPPSPSAQQSDPDKAAKIAEAQAKIAALKAKMAKPPTPAQSADPSSATPQPTAEKALAAEMSPPPPPPEAAGTISRAPVRYDVPPPTSIDDDASDTNKTIPVDEQPRNKKPGQKGFAERLLNKYGWEKGQGLGASGEGITTALVGKVDKQKGQKRGDPDSSERAPPVNMGKIVGGKRRKVDNNNGTENEASGMSNVVKFENMLTGLDVQREIEENNLLQEVGEEMGGKYGTVERVFVWREEMGGDKSVFVKFTSQLSALRAVNGMDEMTFADNKVKARFFDGDAFESGEYGG